MAGRVLVTSGAILAALFGVYYQLYLKGLLNSAGVWRTTIHGLNNDHCTKIPELQACEKMVHHLESGMFYFACSTPISRKYWEPTTDRLNASARSLTDYIASYNPSTAKTTHLRLKGFPTSVPLALHGMDVVTSASNPSELLVYAINHRPPTTGDAKDVGADSVVELFTTKPGSNELQYVKTFEDPSVIITPNDVVGYGDGSFYFTNDHRKRIGITRTLDLYLGLPGKSVGYCHKDQGCKIAYKGLTGANGINEGPDGSIWVANNIFSELFVFEKEDDNTLVLTDTLKNEYEMPMDNISKDKNGQLYIAAFPKGLQLITTGFDDISSRTPSAVIRVSRNTDEGQFYGEKYKIEKIFQDDGNIASGTTTAVWVPKEEALYLTGVNSPHVTVCRI